MSNFYFQQRRAALDLRALSQVDITRIEAETDIDALQSHLENVAFSALNEDDLQHLPDPLVLKLFKLAQLLIEYLLYAQDELVSNLKRLSQKYASKKRDIARKRKELLKLQESTSLMKNQIKVKKQNIRTLENLIQDTKHEKVMKEKEEIELSREAKAKAAAEAAEAAEAQRIESEKLKDVHVTLYVVNTRADCQQIVVDGNTTIGSVLNQCSALLASATSMASLRYRGRILQESLSIRDCNLRSDDQLLLIETPTETEAPQPAKVFSAPAEDESNSIAKSKKDKKSKKEKDSSDSSSYEESDAESSERRSRRRSRDNSIAVELRKLIESRDKMQDKDDNTVLLKEIKDMMATFTATAVKSMTESKSSQDAANSQHAANVDLSVVFLEKWMKLENLLKTEMDKKLASLNVEAISASRPSNFGPIESDSSDSEEERDNAKQSFANNGPSYTEIVENPSFSQVNPAPIKYVEVVPETSEIEHKQERALSPSVNDIVETDVASEVVQFQTIDDSVDQINQSVISELPDAKNVDASDHFEPSEKDVESKISSDSKSVMDGTSDLDSDLKEVESIEIDAKSNDAKGFEAKADDKHAPSETSESQPNSRPISRVSSGSELASQQTPPDKPKRRATTPDKNDIPPRPSTPVEANLESSSNIVLYFADYFDVDKAAVKPLLPPLDISYQGNAHMDSVVFSIRKHASDKLKLPYQHVFLRYDDISVKFGIDLSSASAKDIPLLCKQSRLRLAIAGLATNSISGVSSGIASIGNATDVPNLGSSLTSSAQIDELLDKLRSSDFSQDSLGNSIDRPLPSRLSAELDLTLSTESPVATSAHLKLLSRTVEDELYDLSDKEKISDEEYAARHKALSSLRSKVATETKIELQPRDSEVDQSVRQLQNVLRDVDSRERLSDDELNTKIAELQKIRSSIPEKFSKSMEIARKSIDLSRNKRPGIAELESASRLSLPIAADEPKTNVNADSSDSDEFDADSKEIPVRRHEAKSPPRINKANVQVDSKYISQDSENTLYSSVDTSQNNTFEQKDVSLDSSDGGFLKSNIDNFRKDVGDSVQSEISSQIYSSVDSGVMADNKHNGSAVSESIVYDFNEDRNTNVSSSHEGGTFMTASFKSKLVDSSVESFDNDQVDVTKSWNDNSVNESQSDVGASKDSRKKVSRYDVNSFDEDDSDEDNSKANASMASSNQVYDSLDFNKTIDTDGGAKITPFSSTEILSKANLYEDAAREGVNLANTMTTSFSEVEEFNGLSSDDDSSIAMKKATTPSKPQRAAKKGSDANDVTPFKQLDNDDKTRRLRAPSASDSLRSSVNDNDETNSLAFSESVNDENSMTKSFDSK